MTISITVAIYFMALFAMSEYTGRHATNETFYRAGKKSPWYMVAFGMIGASISGVTFISVPGMVINSGMTYIQTCLGFIMGYFAVAYILLPIYYKLNLTSIYTYLGSRFGNRSYATGAWFFLVSKMTMAAVRFYVVCIILQTFVIDAIGMPFAATVCVMVFLIWLYTHRGGIKTLVLTDTFQTACMLTAVTLIFINVAAKLNLTTSEAISVVANNDMSRIFVFDDWMSPLNFWKQFVSGIFIVIVMTGLDQDMMQKNLTCKTLRDAKKDMCTYGVAFVPVNLIFLSLGVLLVILAGQQNTPLPDSADGLLPMFAATGTLGSAVVILFTIGLLASSFSSADSALTSITTSWCVDIMRHKSDERLRRLTHIIACVIFAGFIIMFRELNSSSVIDAIYTICSYSYGPILGLFAYGLLTRRPVNDRLTPYIAVASPVICFATDCLMRNYIGYSFGYELLMLNGLVTFTGLWLSSFTVHASRSPVQI
ncbi:MAG: sodium:solute symporter [Candidatus Amulumruptor caecigallinarius]|nr:sodium:solute symporter [Candidatus Amulumruptor caecigallinarius]